MKKYIIFATISFFISINAWAQVKNNTTDAVAIKQLLQMQIKAWNNGNIEGYMQGYWQHDSLMFVSKSGITYGWQNTLNNYKKGYPNAASMGTLKIDIERMQQLDGVNFFMVGKWYLVKNSENINGVFTLLFKKIKGKWVIVTDHSS